MALVTVTFYNVRQCGYYERGTQSLAFGSLTQTLQSLLAWVAPGVKPLVETCTHIPDENDELLRTFCFGMRAHATNGDFVFVGWNEIANSDGQVAHIDVSQNVGTAEVEIAELGANQVPGYPSYFWFLPNQDLVANIRFENQRLSGTAPMWGYLKAYLALHGPGVVYGERDDDAESVILGYAETADDEPAPFLPIFQTVQRHRPRLVDEVRGRRDLIRKMIRKTLIAPGHPEDVGRWRSMMMGLGMADPPVPVGGIRAKYELPYRPDAEQLEQIIANWQADDNDEWNDVGFLFQGDTKITWLGVGVGRFEIELNVTGDAQNGIRAEQLLGAISAQRAHLLGLIGI